MPKYKVVIERTVTSREIVELEAGDVLRAALRANSFAVDRTNARGIVIARSHADDPKATTRDDVVQIQEK